MRSEPARVPLAPARLRPFFLRMKLEPMKTLEATASINPLPLSDSIPKQNKKKNPKLLCFWIGRQSKSISVTNYNPISSLCFSGMYISDRNQTNPAVIQGNLKRGFVADKEKERMMDDERESHKWSDATRPSHTTSAIWCCSKLKIENQNQMRERERSGSSSLFSLFCLWQDDSSGKFVGLTES